MVIIIDFLGPPGTTSDVAVAVAVSTPLPFPPSRMGRPTFAPPIDHLPFPTSRSIALCDEHRRRHHHHSCT